MSFEVSALKGVEMSVEEKETNTRKVAHQLTGEAEKALKRLVEESKR